MEIEITREHDLSPEQDREILELQHASFPEADVFVRQRWYKTPLGNDVWFGFRRDGRLVASVRLVPRTIHSGEEELLIGGIGNVCTHPDVRGSGAGKAVTQAVQEYFLTEGEFDFGLLFCGKNLREFYARFGWCDADNVFIYEGPEGETVRREGAGVMICPGRMSLGQWPAGEIDLNGPTW